MTSTSPRSKIHSLHFFASSYTRRQVWTQRRFYASGQASLPRVLLDSQCYSYKILHKRHRYFTRVNPEMKRVGRDRTAPKCCHEPIGLRFVAVMSWQTRWRRRWCSLPAGKNAWRNDTSQRPVVDFSSACVRIVASCVYYIYILYIKIHRGKLWFFLEIRLYYFLYSKCCI